MLACTWPIRDRFLLLPILVGVVSYVVAVWLLRVLGDDELTLLRQIARRSG
jgi:hypothetical protein